MPDCWLFSSNPHLLGWRRKYPNRLKRLGQVELCSTWEYNVVGPEAVRGLANRKVYIELLVHICELVVHMLSAKEKDILVLLFKDFSISYNARSISGKVGMSHRGAWKALKNLEKQGFVTPKPFGKAIEYKFNFANTLAKKSIELFLLEEAELKHRRWLVEFGDLAGAYILVLFGSVVRKENDYNDIDLVVVVAEDKFKAAYKAIGEKQALMIKRIHVVWQSPKDLKSNLKKKDAVILDALRTGVVLKGQAEFVEVVESVASS